MESRKKIGIYSGSFNPVHQGHIQLATFLINQQLVNELWLVVSPCNPLKKQADLIDEYLRLDMLILAIDGKENIKASDIEFCLPIPSYTVDTLSHLTDQYPDYDFCLIIGSDNALVFDQWKNYRLLLARYPIFVYPRRNFDFEQVASLYPEMQLLNSPYFDISSTQIRESIAQKKDVSAWLHPSVYQFITENDLYK